MGPWVRKIPERRKWQPTSVFLPGESYGQRSLVSYSPWSCKELDTTEWLSTAHVHMCVCMLSLQLYIYIFQFFFFPSTFLLSILQAQLGWLVPISDAKLLKVILHCTLSSHCLSPVLNHCDPWLQSNFKELLRRRVLYINALRSYIAKYVLMLISHLIYSLAMNGLSRWHSGKESACQCRKCGSIPEPGRPPGEGKGNPLQYSCLENLKERGAWQATVHRVAKSQT